MEKLSDISLKVKSQYHQHKGKLTSVLPDMTQCECRVGYDLAAEQQQGIQKKPLTRRTPKLTEKGTLIIESMQKTNFNIADPPKTL